MRGRRVGRGVRAGVVFGLAWGSLASGAWAADKENEAEYMATERGISVEQADKRLGWQERAPRLAEVADAELGEAFGGVWIAAGEGDRAKLAVVKGAAMEKARNAIATTGLQDGADIVYVKHGERKLIRIVEWLSSRFEEVDRGAPEVLGAGVRSDLNVVQIDVPRNDNLTAQQRALLAEAKRRHPSAVTFAPYEGRPQPRACAYPHCDPPLRAGIQIHENGVPNCTGSFLARSRSDGVLYQLTAGHCRGANVNWGTRFAGGSYHVIGPFHNAVVGSRGDAGILRVRNPAGWNARAWVFVTAGPDTSRNEAYPILREGTSVVGMRICTTGAFYGRSDCGTVTHLNASIDYGNGVVVRGLGRGNFCGRGGDSGAPMYAGNTAYGIQVAGYRECDSLYQGIRGAEDLMNVDVSFHR